jgi:hypothetical protein
LNGESNNRMRGPCSERNDSHLFSHRFGKCTTSVSKERTRVRPLTGWAKFLHKALAPNLSLGTLKPTRLKHKYTIFMLPGHDLPSQISFSFLSLPDLLHADCAQDAAMDHDAFSLSESTKTHEEAIADPDAYVPVNYICPAVYDLLAAEAGLGSEAEDMELDMNGNVLQGALDGRHELARSVPSMAPPKRYFRTFWRSITRRLLHRSTKA